MPQCPSCHSRLPLSKVFFLRSMACPRCHRELEPQSSVWIDSILLAILTVQGVSYLAERSGLNLPVRVMLSGVCVLAAGVLDVLLVRYRLKGTLSILSPPDASRGNDSPHGN
jgi:hypothetical protein